MKKIFIAPLILLLVGCDQYYRYPCQNPDNWNEPRCKKPLCEVNRDCPELILEKHPVTSQAVETKTLKSSSECPR